MTKVSTCATVRDFLVSGSESPTAELRAHAEGCAPCAELLRDDAALGHGLAPAIAGGETPAELQALRAGLGQALAAEQGLGARLRSLSTPARRTAVAALGLALLAFVVLATARADLAVYPVARLGPTLVAYLALAVTAGHFALSPLQRPLPPLWARVGVVVAAVLLPVVVAALPAAHAAHSASVGGTGADLVPRAAACFSFGSVLAAPLLVLVALSARAPRGVAAVAPLFGVAAGLIGTAALELHCPLTAPAHLVVGHAAVAVVYVVGLSAIALMRRGRG